MAQHCDMTDEEWRRVEPLLPEFLPRTEQRGRPLANTRSVLNGVLWVVCSGATWSAMPRQYPAYQTCHRRFKTWHDEGVLKNVMKALFGEEGILLCDAIETRMRTRSE
jgi:transposase